MHTRPIPIQLQPEAAERPAAPGRSLGIALTTAGAVGNQFGAAMGALAFPTIGPPGVVAVRQIVTAAVLLPIARPQFHRYRLAHWLPILGLALVFSVMNLSLYASVQRIGLGLAVTLEFLGPLAVALATSRRLVDLLCAVFAAAGVVLLTQPGPTADLIGIALGLLAALAWAMYILLNRALGQLLPGVEGAAAASSVAAVAWIPVAIIWFSIHPLTPRAMLLATGCAVLSSVVPYAVDLIALRRVPAGLFGILTSLSPVWAALVGLLVLGQQLLAPQWLGVAIIVASSALVSVVALKRAP